MGFIISSIFLDKFGYTKVYRTSGLLLAFGLIVLYLLGENIGQGFIITSSIMGISRGLYWSTEHLILTKEIGEKLRMKWIYIIISIQLISSFLLPLISSYFITLREGDYDVLFLLTACIVLIFSIFAKIETKTINSRLRILEIKTILSKKFIKRFLILQGIFGGVQSLHAGIFFILPFIFFQNEVSVGFLISISALLVGILTFLQKNLAKKFKLILGIVVHLIWVIISILLAVIWQNEWIVIHSIAMSFVSAFAMSMRTEIDYEIRTMLLGKALQESALEMNMIIEIVFFMARSFILGFISYILILNVDTIESILQFSIVTSTFILFITFILSINLRNLLFSKNY
jgi:MFS family permease